MPVLSWLLCAERSRETANTPQYDTAPAVHCQAPALVRAQYSRPLRARRHRHSPPPNPRQLPTEARPAQPSEPIFFPKLQIHFADFPYLHASSGREAVHLGDLLRIWVRSGTKITLSLGVSRTDSCAPDTARTAVLYGLPISLSPDEPIPGSLSLMKKRQLFPGHEAAFPSSFALPHLSWTR